MTRARRLNYKPVEESAEDTRIVRMLGGIYTMDPIVGSRQLMTVLDRDHGIKVNRKRLQKLRRKIGIETIWCRPRRTSIPDNGHREYPYLLRDMASFRYIPHMLVAMREGGMSNRSLAARLAANRNDRRAWEINDLRPLPWTLLPQAPAEIAAVDGEAARAGNAPNIFHPVRKIRDIPIDLPICMPYQMRPVLKRIEIPKHKTRRQAGHPAKRIGILDDHPIVSSGVKDLLESDQSFQVVGCFVDITALEHFLESGEMDLLILDLRLGKQDGLKLIGPLRARFPDLKILVFSMADEALHAQRAIESGANGYVLKQHAVDQIVTAVRTTLSGNVFFDGVAHTASDAQARRRQAALQGTGDVNSLTAREIEVFRAVGQGLRTKEISDLLGIAIKTVEAHRENIKRKFGVDSLEKLISEATRWCAQNGA